MSLVGYARALEICATGRFVLAEEAERTGLANLAVPAAQLDDAVRDLTAALLAAPRDAVIETKALLRGAQDRSYEDQRTAERASQARRLRDLAGCRRLTTTTGARPYGPVPRTVVAPPAA